MQSEVARLISETLEQEKSQQHQQHLDDHYEHSTEEVGLLQHEEALTSENKTISEHLCCPFSTILNFLSTFQFYMCLALHTNSIFLAM